MSDSRNLEEVLTPDRLGLPEVPETVIQPGGGVLTSQEILDLQVLGDYWNAGKFLDDDGRLMAPPPREWVLENFIPKGKVGMLYGLGGSSKSYLALQAAVSIATGRKFLDTFNVGREGTVVYLSDEDDETDFHERLGYISKAIDLSWEEWSLMEYRLHFEKLSPSILVNEPRQVSKPGDEAKPALSKLCLMSDRVALFILDPMISFFSGEENSSSDANHFISTIERYLTRKGASVLIVHHSNKAPSNSTGPDHTHSRGSTAFRNRSRFAWEMMTITESMAANRELAFVDEAERKRWTVLSLDKGNHMAPGTEVYLRRAEGGVLVRDNPKEKERKPKTSKMGAGWVD